MKIVLKRPNYYNHIPSSLYREEVYRYVEFGKKLPKFLECLLSGDLDGAYNYANDYEINQFEDWYSFFEKFAPEDSFGVDNEVEVYYAMKLAEKWAKVKREVRKMLNNIEVNQ